MKKSPVIAITCFAAFMLFFCTFLHADGSSSRFDRLVPADVNSYVSVTDYQALRRKIRSSPYAGLADEPEFDEFAESLSARIGEQLKDIEKNLGVVHGEFLSILHGRIAVAVVKKGREAAAESLYLIQTAPENSREVQDLLARIKRHAEESEKVALSEIDVAGRRVDAVSLESGLLGTENTARKLFISFHGDTLAILDAPAPELLGKHIELAGGGQLPGGALANLPLYIGLRRKVSQNPDFLSYRNFDLFWKNVLTHSARPAADDSGPGLESILDTLGLLSLRGAVSALSFGSDGILWEGCSHITEPESGLWKTFNPARTPDVSPLPFVDADAALFAAVYFDLPSLWKTIEGALKLHDPALREVLDLSFDLPGGPVNLADDVVDTLGKRCYLYLPAGGAEKPDDAPLRLNAALVFDLDNPERLEGALVRLLDAGAAPYVRLELDSGHTVLSFPEVRAEQLHPAFGPDLVVALSFGFLDDLLIITPDPALMSGLILKSGRRRSPLTASGDFQTLLQRLLPSPAFFAYAELETTVDLLRRLLGPLLEFSELPPPDFEVIKKHLPRVGMTAKWGEDGLYWRCWAPHQDGGGN